VIEIVVDDDRAAILDHREEFELRRLAKQTFENAGFPHLLLETEHETVGGANLRVRVESFIEMIKRRADAEAAA